jgi:5-methylcytosine-specific restriction endonuclease McrA
MSDMFPIWWALACGLLFVWMNAADARDRNVPAEFRKTNPCPATGLTTGRCDGWQIDHITPLCRGGSDTVANLQWLSTAQHKLKTRGDCRTLPGQ